MRRVAVSAENASPFEVDWDDVSLIVAVAGYEPRSTHLVERLAAKWRRDPVEIGRKTLLLEFSTFASLPSRRKADVFYDGIRPLRRVTVSKDSDAAVLQSVSELSSGSGSVILVDYSCMSRLLYLSLVQLVYDGRHVLFSYSLGSYGAAELDYPVSAVGDIKPVPGLEGVHYHSRPTLHVFGLGYDGIGTLALADKLEASRIVTFWADPGAADGSADIARKQNELLINRSLAYFARDIRDVSGTVAVLSRLAFESVAVEKVVFVPVGPKPHVLACALAAAPHEHCGVLAPYLGKGGIREKVPFVEAAGEVVGTLVRCRQRMAPR